MNINANAIIDAISIFMVLIVLYPSLHENGINKSGQKLLNALLICILIVFLADIPAWLLDGIMFQGSRTLCIILNTLYYSAQIVYSRLWLMCIDDRVSGSKRRKTSVRILVSLPMIAEIVLILLNIWTQWIFCIDDSNVYHRGDYYYINLIPYVFYVAGAVLVAEYGVLKNMWNSNPNRRNLLLLFYMLFPILGAIMQSVSYGVSWLWPFAAISLLMMYMDQQTQKLAEQQVATAQKAAEATRLGNELSNSRINIMLSQIHPHFVFNTLSVIQALCDIDPELAAKATDDFTVYLRCNMDSLSSNTLIPFEKELQHTKRYLSLEKLRFEDALNITLDINVTDFSLPALTLQPIVENAVRYGISKCEESGDLLISTAENEEAYIITAEDTGVGFDPTSIKNDTRSHIGIANVRQRLQAMCGGTLIIDSSPGVGTKVTISIPKFIKETGQ